LGTNEKLYKTDTSGNWTTINLPGGLAFNGDTKLYKDLNNNLWIYGRKEVAKLNANNTWTSYSSSIDLPKNATVNSMTIDRNNVLWTIVDGELRKGNRVISANVSFSALGYSEAAGRVWVVSPTSNVLYYVSEASNILNSIPSSGVSGCTEVKFSSNGEIYFNTAAGIVRTNSSGSVISSYNSGTTGGMITGRPSTFDLDGHGNLWVLLGDQLYKLPIANSGNTKKYSFNQDLSNLSSISVLNLSQTDSDILLAKNSGNGAIKIR
jgi:ligand-binding sensor domain-containing protein